MNKLNKNMLAGIGIVITAGIAALAWAGPQGKIAPWDAMKSATAKVGGKAIQATYLVEGGKPLYDVVVINGKKLSEVEVDALTGKAGSVEAVTPSEEGKELVESLNVALSNKKPTPEKDEAGK
ncbi:MAG: PepSY domain-containing protein [Armatimonas sp.]